MRVLVIGGTRFIGAAAVHRLSAMGHTVTVLHRGKSEGELPTTVQHLREPSLNLIGRENLSAYRDLIARAAPDVVIDMLLMTEQDANITLNLLNGITSRFVLISSGDVYRSYGRLIGTEPGPLDPVPATEDSPLREKLYPYRTESSPDKPRSWTDDYDKIPIEQRVMNTAGIRGTVLRLPMVYGPHDEQHRLFPYIKRITDNRPAILLDAATANWSTSRSYVENAGEAIALAAVNEQAAGRIYNVSELQAYTEAEWVKLIGNAMGWTGKVIVLSPDQTPDSLKSEMNMQQNLTTDSSRIRQELGYQEIVPQEEALRQTIDWERLNMPSSYPPTMFNYEIEDQILDKLGL